MQTANATGAAAKIATATETIRASRNQRVEEPNAWIASLRAAAHDDLEKRGTLPDLDPAKILEWADAFRARTGDWPSHAAGAIPEAPGETWLLVEAALTLGSRGLPGGSTINQLLEERPGRFHRGAPQFTVQEILDWADAWHAATGEWPTVRSGEIPNTSDMTWRIVNFALRQGRGGVPAGSTLARLLSRERDAGQTRDVLPFDIPTILGWADAHHARHGTWPKSGSGPIPECPGEKWSGVNRALREGLRGLTGGSTLPRLLSAGRSVRMRKYAPPLTERQVLDWADLHQARTGSWPTIWSGPIPEAVGEQWQSVNSALYAGARGLTGGSSVARLLAERRNVRNRKGPPALSVAQILRWADNHHAHTSQWPVSMSGPLPERPGETWRAISAALRKGTRGLPGGTSLARLLQERRGAGKHKDVR